MPCCCGGEVTADEAERLAIPFGLTYLSREGYAKLALLLEAVKREAQQDERPILEHGRPIK